MKSRYPYSQVVIILLWCIVEGCMVGKQYTKPQAPTNIAYRDTAFSDTSKLMQWFDLYRDDVLKTIIKRTLDSNRNMLAAAARIDASRSQTAAIKANLYPQLNYAAQGGAASAGSEAAKVAGVVLPGSIQGGYIGAFGQLNWELDLWGKVRRQTRSAYAQFLANIDIRNGLEVSLVGEAATQYFILRDLDNRLAIAKQTVASRQERLRIITERFDKGYVSELDKLMAIEQLTLATTQVPTLQRQIIQTENALRLLMAMGPGTIDRGPSNFDQSLSPTIPVGLPSELLERRPDIRSAEESLQAQFEQIGVAQANRLPSISLTGLLGFASPQLSTLVSSNGLVSTGFGTVLGPIFNFNQNKRLVEVQQKKTQEIYYQYQQTVLSAFGDVDNALAQYKTLVEEYTQLEIQVEAAQKALALSSARYDAGYTSYLEVTILENNLFNAQLQQSVTLQQKLNAIVGLYKALGGGWDLTP